MSKTILITGATGKQGCSVLSNLSQQDSDVEILAVTRDLVQGNLDQPEEIFETAKKATSQPIWGVYSVQLANFGGKSDIEETQGKGLVDAALKNNVKHFVYSSVDRGGDASLDNPTAIPHFRTKHNIELHLISKTKGTDMTWTILRPVAFLDGSFVSGFVGRIFATVWKIALKGKPLQVIAAFTKPDEYKGKGISLAGDELSFDEMTNIFKSTTGKDVPMTFDIFGRLFMWLVADFGEMFRWFHDDGYKADIQAAKKIHPGLKDLRAWLETESDWRN
ncbi:hypothetical protein BDV12DRAFT_182080 [Aspergillus spectabilis]